MGFGARKLIAPTATIKRSVLITSAYRWRTMSFHSRSGLTVSTLIVGALLATTASSASAEELAAVAASVATKQPNPPRKPLDLRPPDVTQLFTSEQLNRILAATFRENIEEVEVEGEREYLPSTPTVWPGIAAPIWALLNPAESWRIFAPLPPDQTRHMRYARANATDAYVLEPAGVPSPPAGMPTSLTK
jgi:hypothetical protein